MNKHRTEELGLGFRRRGRSEFSYPSLSRFLTKILQLLVEVLLIKTFWEKIQFLNSIIYDSAIDIFYFSMDNKTGFSLKKLVRVMTGPRNGIEIAVFIVDLCNRR